MSAQLQIYKCITLECPYRNKGYPSDSHPMVHYGMPQKKGKTKQNKEKQKEDNENKDQ